MKGRKRITKEVFTEYVNFKTGEISSENLTKEWIVDREEPDFIKLYFNAICGFNDVSPANVPVLMALLPYMTYADDSHGGQIIGLTSYIRDRICEKLNIKPETLRKNINALCDGKILRKIATNTYQANPHLFGKGDWKSIKNLRGSFDWEHGMVVTVTEHEE